MRQLDRRIDPHLFKNVGPVKLDRARRDAQVVGDVLVVVTANQLVQHLTLARAQRDQRLAQAARLRIVLLRGRGRRQRLLLRRSPR